MVGDPFWLACHCDLFASLVFDIAGEIARICISLPFALAFASRQPAFNLSVGIRQRLGALRAVAPKRRRLLAGIESGTFFWEYPPKESVSKSRW